MVPLFRARFQVEIKTVGIDYALTIPRRKKRASCLRTGTRRSSQESPFIGRWRHFGGCGRRSRSGPGTDGGREEGGRTGGNGLFYPSYRAMKPVNRMMNVRDVNLTGDSGRLRRTADAANTDPYITFIAAQALVIPCTVRSLRIGR